MLVPTIAAAGGDQALHAQMTKTLIGTWQVDGHLSDSQQDPPTCTPDQEHRIDSYKNKWPCKLKSSLTLNKDGTFECSGNLSGRLACDQFLTPKWELEVSTFIRKDIKLRLLWSKKGNKDYFGMTDWTLIEQTDGTLKAIGIKYAFVMKQ